ncbi:MAG: hypothetical protein ACRD1X_14550 [Vicinamibacteria bacterium]
MSREILAGSLLNEIWSSLRRYPGVRVLVWNPHRVSISDVAAGVPPEPPIDLSPHLEEIALEENIGFENGDDPSVPRADFRFKRNPHAGTFRVGWIADGVIVQVLQGDRRVDQDDWMPVFTGTFRGRPGDDPGTRAEETEGLAATAFGREERYLNLEVTTNAFPGPVDVGAIAHAVATSHMGLGQDEILFGAQGFESRHVTNQLVEINALQAVYECFFPVGKKPKFDARGRLVAVDADLDKPAARIYPAGNIMVVRRVAAPNDIEVANQVILRGLSHDLTRVVQEAQVLVSLTRTCGFFESEVDDQIFYSDDHTQRAQDTFVLTRKKIKWSNASWTEVDEFSGRLQIDTHFLRNARAIIFVVWLALEASIAVIDLFFQGESGVISIITSIFGINVTVATLRFILKILANAALAGLLWAMQFVGTGRYEIWGKPFEYVYQELVSDNRLTGLDPEELRKAEYRNDFVSTIEELDELGAKHLRREVLKNQVYELEILDDPLLEVDDVVELGDGSRYYVTTLRKTLRRNGRATMTLTAWKVFDPVSGYVEAIANEGAVA